MGIKRLQKLLPPFKGERLEHFEMSADKLAHMT